MPSTLVELKVHSGDPLSSVLLRLPPTLTFLECECYIPLLESEMENNYHSQKSFLEELPSALEHLSLHYVKSRFLNYGTSEKCCSVLYLSIIFEKFRHLHTLELWGYELKVEERNTFPTPPPSLTCLSLYTCNITFLPEPIASLSSFKVSRDAISEETWPDLCAFLPRTLSTLFVHGSVPFVISSPLLVNCATFESGNCCEIMDDVLKAAFLQMPLLSTLTLKFQDSLPAGLQIPASVTDFRISVAGIDVKRMHSVLDHNSASSLRRLSLLNSSFENTQEILKEFPNCRLFVEHRVVLLWKNWKALAEGFPQLLSDSWDPFTQLRAISSVLDCRWRLDAKISLSNGCWERIARSRRHILLTFPASYTTRYQPTNVYAEHEGLKLVECINFATEEDKPKKQENGNNNCGCDWPDLVSLEYQRPPILASLLRNSSSLHSSRAMASWISWSEILLSFNRNLFAFKSMTPTCDHVSSIDFHDVPFSPHSTFWEFLPKNLKSFRTIYKPPTPLPLMRLNKVLKSITVLDTPYLIYTLPDAIDLCSQAGMQQLSLSIEAYDTELFEWMMKMKFSTEVRHTSLVVRACPRLTGKLVFNSGESNITFNYLVEEAKKAFAAQGVEMWSASIAGSFSIPPTATRVNLQEVTTTLPILELSGNNARVAQILLPYLEIPRDSDEDEDD